MPKTVLETSPAEVATRPQTIVPVDKTPVVAKPLPAATMSGAPPALLTNHGGKVLGNVQVIPIYWGAAWATAPYSGLAAQLDGFFDFILTVQ